MQDLTGDEDMDDSVSVLYFDDDSMPTIPAVEDEVFV